MNGMVEGALSKGILDKSKDGGEADWSLRTGKEPKEVSPYNGRKVDGARPDTYLAIPLPKGAEDSQEHDFEHCTGFVSAPQLRFSCSLRYDFPFPMQKIGFAQALDDVAAADPRFHRDAYIFLRDALDFTLKQRKKENEETSRHVTGQELLEGIRQYALKEFGPMVMMVFSYWGIRRCEDFGVMVYNLIDAGVFGKTETDSIDDFKSGYDFTEAFVTPYRPWSPTRTRSAEEEKERSPDGELRK